MAYRSYTPRKHGSTYTTGSNSKGISTVPIGYVLGPDNVCMRCGERLEPANRLFGICDNCMMEQQEKKRRRYKFNGHQS